MTTLSNRLRRAEQAAGIGEPCEACELLEAFIQPLAAKLKEWGAGRDDSAAPTVTTACHWCGKSGTGRLVGLSVAEAADFNEVEAIYWRGEMCRPEYNRLAASTREALSRSAIALYGEARAAEIEKSVRGYAAELDKIRQAPLPYLCRVPDCKCEYPKTFDEWRANAEANGYRVSGLYDAVKSVRRR